MTPPILMGQDGWAPLEPIDTVGVLRSFVSGDPGGDRLRVRYFRRDHDGALVGRAWFGPGAEGPPGHAHGGSMAALLDEAMGAAAWMSGHCVVAARLVTESRGMLPLGTVATFEAWVESIDGRKVGTRARLSGADGQAFAVADALFIMLDAAWFAELAQRPTGVEP